ncbi:multidrug ABC transporter ATP-binding protein [Nesterenkonia sp. AN1]|uniref:ABC-2 type transport system ATP-binding protein n=1 Tax=Nesterenkonia aurantiaca TaxID=1436010 RepID=A0A4R7G5K8_9MICC|nr:MULTISPECIES: ABC transporter ATP-binding protein [Nesterenkonia]EXF24839.1 multidrug ABC transporter ATP-binding protein [Nesterenkonia sp. AN1]TDS86763.1 ABC-2 type transport system ATP-binding protein [Nesterenkonia aurantiaca]
MITASGLRKTYGERTAVDGISFALEPGRVTGFLGPNGAGKSTTMRLAMGLDRPSAGQITINGRPYAEHRAPLREVGAVLDAGAWHPGWTGEQQLRILAATHAIPKARVQEVIEMTGLSSVATRRIKSYSLGMTQRLGIAAAMLGDPGVLIFDEPINGLDPEGVRWVRQLVRRLAAQGRTVFISSHLMSEMAQTADHLIVLGQGRIIADQPLGDFIDPAGETRVLVRTEDAQALMTALAGAQITLVCQDAETFEARGIDARSIGRRALEIGVVIHELTPLHSSLEESYLRLTGNYVEHRSGGLL